MSDSGLIWPDWFGDLPYAQPFLARWLQSRSAESPWLPYEQALEIYLSSRKDQGSAVHRYQGLLACRDRLEGISASNDVPFATRLLLGRLSFELGSYRAAADRLEPLAKIDPFTIDEHSALNCPFLPPLAAFDHRPPVQGDISSWLQAAVLETLELCSGATSYVDPRSHLPRLSSLKQNPNCSPSMVERLALCAMRSGRTISFGEDSPFLREDNPNREVWRELAHRVSAPLHKIDLPLRPIPPSPQVTTPLELQIGDLRHLACSDDRALTIECDNGEAVTFSPLGCTEHAVFGRSSDQRWFVKIELAPHPFKRNNLLQEAEIIRQLNALGCVSCPSLHGQGTLRTAALAGLCPLPQGVPDTLPALILPYLSTQPTLGLHDLLFALEEQRKLGWFHADLKPDNIRFCPETQVCYLIDYDQAEPLDQPQIEMSLVDFLRWADQRVRAKYSRFNFNGLFNYFPGIRLERDVLSRLDQGRIDIGQAKLLRSAETTLNPSKIYHTINLPSIVAYGERTLDARMRLMNEVRFFPGERVLDIGCNSGLLCAYLASRGCQVKGVDLDPYVIRAARMLANVRGDHAAFACVDLDLVDDLGSFDTIMLFSVLHHTQQVPRNAALIAKSCKRIIIECRLREQGAKPVDGRWMTTTVWSYDNVDALIRGVRGLFPGFQLLHNHGQADRDRYVLEFTKGGGEWSGSSVAEDDRSASMSPQTPPSTVSTESRDTKKAAEQKAIDLFLLNNRMRWTRITPADSDRCILVELLVGHPGYFIANAVLAKYLQQFHGCRIKAILPARDNAYMHALAASYGITDYYYEEDIGRQITQAHQSAMYKALQGSGAEFRKALLEVEINGIRVGDLIYDMYLRNTGNVTADSLDDQLFQTAVTAIGYYQLYDAIFSSDDIVATAVGHTVYTRFGILTRVSLSHDVPVYAKKPSPLLVRKYTRLDELPQLEWTVDEREFSYLWDSRRDHLIAKGKARLSDQFSSNASSVSRDGMARWYSDAYGTDRKSYSRSQFCDSIGIDPGKPIVVLFSHAMPDAPHSCRAWLFDDYYQWLRQTLIHAVGVDRVNWVVKSHPDDKHYNSKISAEAVYEEFAHCPHIALAPADLNNQSLFDFVHAVVTVTGTAGIEFASQGVPVILAGRAHYSGHGFTYEPDTLAKYYKLLDGIAGLPRLDQGAIDRVHALVAIQFYYMRARCVYMPDMPLTPWEPYDLADIWSQAAQRAARYDFAEDPFFRALLVQLATGAKHLIRYDEEPVLSS